MRQKKNKYITTAVAAVILVILYGTFGLGCPQQAFLGISCPGCGMTRAYLALFHGNIRGAFFYHTGFPLVPLAAFFLLFRKKLPGSIFKIGITAVLILFISIYLFRISIHDPVLTVNIKNGYLYRFWKIIYGIIMNLLAFF
jgi:hypothetical protein